LFILAMALTQIVVPTSILNGSLLYFPPLIMLVFVGTSLLRRGHFRLGRIYALGAAVFALSLSMRTIDLAVCEVFPLGTHFLWHTFNGICLGLLIFVALEFEKDGRKW